MPCPTRSSGPDGKPVNALLGTANLILREIEIHQPRAVAALLQGPTPPPTAPSSTPPTTPSARRRCPTTFSPQFAACRDFFSAVGTILALATQL